MTVSFDIGLASVSARLVGPDTDAAPLDRALRRMLTEEVLPAAAKALEGRYGEEAILCLAQLPLSVSLTLEEALSGSGARRWADRMVDGLMRRLETGRGAWVFADVMSYLAAFLRTRLGLERIPAAAFSGLGALELLPPIQAVCEALRSNRALWVNLTDGTEADCGRFVKAVAAQGGDAALVQVLRSAMPDAVAAAVPQDRAAALVRIVQMLSASADPTWRWVVQPRTGQRVSEAALLAALALAQDVKANAAAAGLILALMLSGTKVDGDVVCDDSVVADLLRRAEALSPRLRAQAVALIDALAGQTDGPAALAALAGQVARLRAQTAARPKAPLTDARDEVAKHAVPDAGAGPYARIFQSPVAGVALCLPFLTENRIGRDFPAQVRLEALALLAADGPVEDPLADPFLMALCGNDEKTSLPERPAEIDMLFVPLDRHRAIIDAAPGAARLAVWAEARLAASLPGIGGSSRAFLQSQFFHRPGRLILSDDRAVIEVDAMPLRPVLEMGAVLGENRGPIDWLDGQQISLRVREVST